MLSLLPNHQEEEDQLSWVARDSQDMLKSRIHSRCAARCILMVESALESKPCQKFGSPGRWSFRSASDRIPQKNACYPTSSCIFLHQKKIHIPSDLVVDQWASDGESSSDRNFLTLLLDSRGFGSNVAREGHGLYEGH
jgi:hypothetical protein